MVSNVTAPQRLYRVKGRVRSCFSPLWEAQTPPSRITTFSEAAVPKHCPASVKAAFAGVLLGAAAGALDPGTVARHVGWAVALIALAALFIGLTRWVVAEIASARRQFLGQVAEMRIGRSNVRVPDSDGEWNSLHEE